MLAHVYYLSFFRPG